MITLVARWNRLRRSPRFPYLVLLVLLTGGVLSQVYSYWWGRRIQHMLVRSGGHAQRNPIISGNLRSTIGSQYLEPLEPIRSIWLNGQRNPVKGHHVRTAEDDFLLQREWHDVVHTAEDLREIKWLPFLNSLVLCSELTPDAWVALAELRQLKRLTLFRQMPASEYARLGRMTRLTTLTLHFDSQTPATAIREIARLPNLKVLTLRHDGANLAPPNTIDAQMRELAKCESLSRLEVRLDDSGLLALTECPDDRSLLNLLELRLDGSHVSNAGLVNLSRLPSLIHLDLNRSHVTDEGLVTFQTISWLKTLYLEGCQGITDTGADELAEMTKLESLNVSQTKLTRTGLFKLGALKRLRSLWISESFEGDSVVPDLRHEFSPLCRIRRSLVHLPTPIR